MGFSPCFRMFVTVGLGVGLAPCLIAQAKDGLTIDLDQDIRPEAVHVHYFLTGGFGGYGYGNLTDGTAASAQEVFLPIYRDGQRATSLKAVVYATGCELTAFALDPLPPIPGRIRFECHKLRAVWLKGVVTGYPHPSELTVRVRYIAHWSHAFFGIADGPVLSLAIAEVVPDRDGKFAVEVPDFANDDLTKSYKGQAEWSITGWKTGTNDQYWLNSYPQDSKIPGALAIQGEYPQRLQFIARQF
jgi:hypothetical protein